MKLAAAGLALVLGIGGLAPAVAQAPRLPSIPQRASGETSASGTAAGALPGPADPGAVLAQAGGPGVAACSSCHGERGEGKAAGGFPRLAGQPAAYLARQLALYADGGREHPVMSPVARSLDQAARLAVSNHYAGLVSASAGADVAGAASRASLERGRTLAQRGDERLRVQGCNNCHGPDGTGNAPVFPSLAAQVKPYLVAALHGFKDGRRRTDTSRQMNDVAASLSPADIDAVAHWYASRAPAARRLMPPDDALAGTSSALPAPRLPAARIDHLPGPAATGRPAVEDGAAFPGSAGQSVGTSQGDPTVSGGQGQTSSGSPR